MSLKLATEIRNCLPIRTSARYGTTDKAHYIGAQRLVRTEQDRSMQLSGDWNPSMSLFFQPYMFHCFQFRRETGFPREKSWFFWYMYVCIGLRGFSIDRHRRFFIHFDNSQVVFDSFHMSTAEVTTEYDRGSESFSDKESNGYASRSSLLHKVDGPDD